MLHVFRSGQLQVAALNLKKLNERKGFRGSFWFGNENNLKHTECMCYEYVGRCFLQIFFYICDHPVSAFFVLYMFSIFILDV